MGLYICGTYSKHIWILQTLQGHYSIYRLDFVVEDLCQYLHAWLSPRPFFPFAISSQSTSCSAIRFKDEGLGMSSIACSVGNSKSQTSFSAKAIALILCGVCNSHGRHVHSLVLLKARLQVQIAGRFHNTTHHSLIRVSFRGVTPSCDFLCMFRLGSQYNWPHLWILYMDAHKALF